MAKSNMDKMLTINWAGGSKIPTTQFFWDGRGDPYGKSKIGEGGAHSKALHLRPFATAVQRGAEVLHVSALDTNWKNIGHNKDEVKQLGWRTGPSPSSGSPLVLQRPTPPKTANA